MSEHQFDIDGETDDGWSDGFVDVRERAVEKAFRLYQVDRLSEAENELRSILALEPNDGGALSLLSVVLLTQGRREEAKRTALESLAVNPESVYALCAAAEAHARSGENTSAERMLIRAIRIDPQDSGPWVDYAKLTYKVGQLAKAKRLAERARALDPSSTGAHQLLSLIASERSKHREAAVHGGIALSHEPDDSGSHLVQGMAKLRGGRPFTARRHFRTALQADPSDEYVLDLFVEADRCCRLTYLPAYYFDLVVGRIPGGPFVLWGAFVVLVAVLSGLGAPPLLLAIVVFGYPALCIYTWIASPITRLWMKIVPTR